MPAPSRVSSALLGLGLLAGCTVVPTDPTPSRQGELIVDAHAHAFTALHLPVSGFVAAYSGGNAQLGRFVERLVLLQAPQDCVPEDGAFGDRPDADTCVAWIELARASSPLSDTRRRELSGDALEALGEEGFDKVWRCRMEQATQPATPDVDALTDAELDQVLDFALGDLAKPPAALARLGLDLGARTLDAVDPLDLRARLERYVLLVWTLTRSSSTVAGCLRETYPAADLSLAAMLDMQRGFPLDQQVEDMARAMEEHLGNLHAFLPFDPLRDVQTGGGSLRMVQRNLARGFVGVKLYPPMGFRASGNALQLSNEGPDAPRADELDASLEALFAWCADADVPITAHCNPTGAESAPGRGRRSHPRYWAPVLERHPNLRVNFGHFGGHDLGVPGGWSETIGDLMDEYPHVYADIAYHDLPADPMTLTAWRLFLVRHPIAARRLLFGTDWPLILQEQDGHAYLARYRALFDEQLPELVPGLLGENALRFLGLLEQTDNRRRLEAFYDDQDDGFRPSRWWPFVERLQSSR
mgnify:CR=1 FL=1